MHLRKLTDLDLTNKKVFLRLDLNVPIKNGKITDDTRITAALPTIEYILERTHKVAICSHLGRPKGKATPEFSLEPIGHKLAELLGREVVFIDDYLDEPCDQVLNQLQKNQFMLMENLRFHPGEEKNDPEFAHKLIRGFDFFVNDAFGTMHRAHASVTGVAEILQPSQRACGFLVEKEVEALGGLLSAAKSPYTVVMGGAKVSDKIGVILNLLNRCNNLLIGGAMAYTFLKFQGVNVGSSKVEEDKMDVVESIYRNAELRKVRIELPVDHVAATEFAANATPFTTTNNVLSPGLMGLDIGPKTAANYQRIIEASSTVLWNGPMGVFEWPPFSHGSMAVAKAMAACHGFTVVGGGDSVSAVNAAGVADKISHISTGGGASLEFLEGVTLPGIRVLQK